MRHCKDNNVEIFSKVFDWFNESLQVIFPHTVDKNINERIRTDKIFQSYLISLLSNVGTGISNIKVLNQVERLENLRKESKNINGLGTKLNDFFEKIDNNKELREDWENQFEIYILHGDIEFEKFEESSGTQRLFDLAFSLYDLATSKKPKVYIIDELENSLHTNLSFSILKNFLEKDGKNQLVATTHDTHLLDLELLRKDEIWFAEKNSEGATELYSLYEFNPRYDKKIEKEYLTGRFGAIPFLGNLEFKRKLAENGKSKK